MSSRTRRNYDIISSLPDEVLCHILAFLPTQQAVATSVLSKRWTHLWRSLLHIDLTNGQNHGEYHYEMILLNDEYNLSRFNEFVYSVLLKLDSIKSFRIGVVYDNSDLEYIGFPSVVNWVNHVVQYGVESLYLTLFTMTDDFKFKFPVSILTCRTLVVLDFFGFSVEGLSSVRLPSLKILHFIETSFVSARDLVFLLSGCPNLEDLSTSHIEFDSDQSLTYQECESLDLRKLTVAYMPLTCCHFPLKALHNVAELHVEINKVYRSFDEIPTFHNLTRLKLHSINSNWDLLVQVLNHCPNLQNLELDEGTACGKRDYVLQNWVDPDLVPQCLSLHLKTCKFKNFLGQQGEIMSARYILKNAKVLQTMKIYGGKGLKVERELSLCPRASPTCELIIKANRRSLFAYQFL